MTPNSLEVGGSRPAPTVTATIAAIPTRATPTEREPRHWSAPSPTLRMTTSAPRVSRGVKVRLVADATELTNEQAEELLVVESAVRDALTAPGLLTPAVREAVLAARRRGARVEVRRTIAGAGVTPDQPLPEAAVAAFSAAVGEARAGDAVRLSWRPADTRLPVVLTYVGQDADSVATRIRRSLGGLGSGGPGVSTDADSVLVEIHGPAPAG